MTPTAPFGSRWLVRIALLAFACLATEQAAWAQASALLSPGPLSRAHSSLEGLGNCAKCHEPGRQVTASRCLACHRPIAERIAARRGVHRNVKDDCVRCHSEHNGAGAELRPFDARHFDHAAETGFPLDGRHAAIAITCAKCHAGRSFLQARPSCSSCHADPHRGSLGGSCTTCHSTRAAFADARQGFDHSRARFQLVGAHRAVDCARCHVNKAFVGIRFASCSDCHKSPHRQPLGAECASCHGNDSWRTQKVDHSRTAFPLRGRHEGVACASCHRGSPVLVRVEFARCGSCHADVHKGQFKEDCASCHQDTGFRSTSFDHGARTKFALTGRHAGLPCSRCHPNASTITQAQGALPAAGRIVPNSREPARTAAGGAARRGPVDRPVATVLFSGASTACSSCHADPHGGETGPSCTTCHTTNDFRAAGYQHDARLAAFFAGRHAAASCADCHGRLVPRPRQSSTDAPVPVSKWRFKAIGTACGSCHTDPHKGETGPDCTRCHSTKDFRAAGYQHDTRLAAFFAGRHASASCADCHGRLVARPLPEIPAAGTRRANADAPAPVSAWRFKALGTTCGTCHADAHQGQLGNACETCHAIDETRFSGSRFSHDKTGFPLTGKHQAVDCAHCHRPARAPAQPGPTRLPGARVSSVDPRGSRRAAVVLAGLQTPAAAAPPATAPPAPAQQAKPPLVFKGMGKDCASCHADVHLGQLGTQCQRCHGSESFRVPTFTHKDKGLATFFKGTHATLSCRACHKPEQARFPAGIGTAVRYVGTGTSCRSCHATEDTHRGALGTRCETCHEPAAWKSASRAFHKDGLFPLEGRHLSVPCASCHVNGVMKGTPTNCFDCHWIRRQDDRYQTRLGTQCEQCHRPTSWTAVQWNHAASTGFQLNLAHQVLRCDNCHKDGQFTGTSNNCYGCHQAAYSRTSQPNHLAAGFPTNCEVCHSASQTSWTQATFDHRAYFPLVGVHASQACSTCHRNEVYSGTPRDCIGCHRADYQRTQSPNHAAAGFPTTCDACHRASDASWTGASFNHANFFPLVGVHAAQACASCHKNNVYSGTARDCVSCHQADYQKTQNPNHVSAGFPTTCESCHRASDASWVSGSFNHSSFFPLVGAHGTQACTTCHKNGVYKGTPRDCVGCHQADYQRSQNPNHAAAGFPTTCDTCHSASASTWSASFDHNRFYPLLGRHLQQPCSACHKNNVYRGTPSDCFSCHQANYQSTQNPNHTAAGFPTTCQPCHRPSDSSWQQGTFNHTWFPITSGPHAGNACATCHTSSGNFAVFTCTNCHGRATTDSHHTGVAGYRYDSAACYSCHPTGRAGD